MLLWYSRVAALLLPFLCSLTGSALAQAPPAPAPPAQPTSPPAQPASPPTQAPPPAAPLPTAQNLTVMVVDVQALLQNSKAAKMVRSQIEQNAASTLRRFRTRRSRCVPNVTRCSGNRRRFRPKR